MTSKKLVIFYCLVLIFSVSIHERVDAQQQKPEETISVTLHSEAENTDHRLLIQLPKNYGRSVQKYPVIFLFDAQDQSLFSYTSTVIDRLAGTNHIPEAIFVGIVQNDRSKELNVEKNGAASELFLQFIKDDLLTYLNKYYDTDQYYTFIGHSLGGQFVTHAMTRYPEIFRSVISVSGALNYPVNDPEYSFYKRKVLREVENYIKDTKTNVKQRYYFSVGTDGMQDKMFTSGALSLDRLLNRYRSPVLSWRFKTAKEFDHMTTPTVSIPEGLLFIYHDWHFSEESAMDVLLTQKKDALQVIQQKQDQICSSYGIPISLPVSIYYQFAYNYLNKKQFDQAKKVTEQLITIFPDDDEPYALMADILSLQGRRDEAVLQLKLAQSKSNESKYSEKLKELEHQYP